MGNKLLKLVTSETGNNYIYREYYIKQKRHKFFLSSFIGYSELLSLFTKYGGISLSVTESGTVMFAGMIWQKHV